MLHVWSQTPSPGFCDLPSFDHITLFFTTAQDAHVFRPGRHSSLNVALTPDAVPVLLCLQVLPLTAPLQNTTPALNSTMPNSCLHTLDVAHLCLLMPLWAPSKTSRTEEGRPLLQHWALTVCPGVPLGTLQQ